MKFSGNEPRLIGKQFDVIDNIAAGMLPRRELVRVDPFYLQCSIERLGTRTLSSQTPVRPGTSHAAALVAGLLSDLDPEY